jgi:hypothetical protein
MRGLILGLLAASAAGCSDAGPRPVVVRGTVTFDGAPLERGDIVFEPSTPGPHGASAGTIEAGKFAFPASAGAMTVRIRATRPAAPGSKLLGPSGQPVPENFIPPRYNRKSELTADVKADGPNEFVFELKSK